MSYVSQIEVVQNDYGYELQFKIVDAEGNPVDLTGATVKIFIAEPGAAKAKVSSTCYIVDAQNGLCRYIVQEGDFNEAPKTYQVELELNYADRVITAKGVTIKVVKELPETV